jgi:hypothetical protein
LKDKADTNLGITAGINALPNFRQPFQHVIAGLHLGAMTPNPHEGEFDSILSVGDEPGSVPDLVHHRHVPLNYSNLDIESFTNAVHWTLGQLAHDRKILVRSERGLQRPALVVAVCILRMGGSYYDATSCVWKANPQALSDFRYKQLLANIDQVLKQRTDKGDLW